MKKSDRVQFAAGCTTAEALLLCPRGVLQHLLQIPLAVGWSETVRLRRRSVSDQNISLGLGLAHCGLGLGLAGLVLCCETRSCHARRHNNLERHNNFSSTVFSLSILCLEHHYCEDQQRLCVLPMVLVLVLLFNLFWSWS